MSLHKLVFDTTDTDSIAASANVGAYLRASDGALLTHTDVGGKKALDVRVAEGINVEVDLNAADDSVAAWLSDGSGNAISSTGGALHISDAGGSLTVDATNLDIRDLTAASDSVAAWAFDGTGNAITSTAGALDVNIASGTVTTSDAALADSAIKALAETVTNTAAQIVDGGDELASRKYLFLYNNGNKTVFIGETGVTASSGFPLPPGSILEARIGAAVDVFAISQAGSQNVRTLQLS